MDGRTDLAPRLRSSTLLRQPRARWLAQTLSLVPPKPQAAAQWPLPQLQRARAAALEAEAATVAVASLGLCTLVLHAYTLVRHRPTCLHQACCQQVSWTTSRLCPSWLCLPSTSTRARSSAVQHIHVLSRHRGHPSCHLRTGIGSVARVLHCLPRSGTACHVPATVFY